MTISHRIVTQAVLLLLPLGFAGACKPRDSGAGSNVLDASSPTHGLSVAWHHGVPECDSGNNTDEPIQIYKFDKDTIILRQNMCLNPEAPFLYLLFGSSKAFLLDTGAVEDATAFPLRSTVDQLLKDHGGDLPLIVAHTHGHGDHTAGDPQFDGRPDTELVGLGAPAVLSFFGFSSMTGPAVELDLGDRILDVMPIPGHLTDHIAIYDRKTTILLSGDTLYPGRLYVQAGQWAVYKASISRLWNFIKEKPVAYVLGAHVEMTLTPKKDYPYSVTSRPDEHILELSEFHLNELNSALQSQTSRRCDRHSDFIIWPLDANCG